MQRIIVMDIEKFLQSPRAREILLQVLTPRRAALEGECRIELVGAIVDPLAERLARRPLKGLLQALAVFQGNDVPADGDEEVFDLIEQMIIDYAVQALPVIVDHPPQIAHVVLPAFQQGLEDVAFVKLGVAHHRHHAS